MKEHYDVVIIGAGLAGLSLSRQLLRNSDKTILLLEKSEVPSKRQKVGESLVQVGGYYFSKVLDLEEYLLREHYMKYNLRFYWKNPHRDNKSLEDFGQAYIRTFSNIPCYQLDRNKLEGELLTRNCAEEPFEYVAPVKGLKVSLADPGPHTIDFTADGSAKTVTAEWVVDTSGRNKVLPKQMALAEKNPIEHGSSFYWVDGLVDIEKLTDLSPKEIRLNGDRKKTGHLPLWLATNHFMGEGFWFWVIPLQGITSLGLVYDSNLIDHERVSTPERLCEWICEEFPLFARDLPERKILDRGFLKSYSYGCRQTIHKSKWALSGESGRFTDPLYSPGSDFIAVHNTLIIDAILSEPNALAGKCYLYETLARSLYESLIPTYSLSYDALGDQETFVLKYTWELSAYFAFFVFPMINDLSTDRRFVVSYLSKFSRLGKTNENLQKFLSGYYQWKKSNTPCERAPLFHDFASIGTLRDAESTFYEIGLDPDEAKQVLNQQLLNLQELARYIVAYLSSIVLSEPALLTDRAFIEEIDLKSFKFDPEELRRQALVCDPTAEPYQWSFDPYVMEHFRTAMETHAAGDSMIDVS